MSEQWLNAQRKRYAAKLRAEWADQVGGRDREFWRREAKRTRTDWSSLLRQRIKMQWWVRLGRPPLSEYLKLVRGGN